MLLIIVIIRKGMNEKIIIKILPDRLRLCPFQFRDRFLDYLQEQEFINLKIYFYTACADY